MPTNKDIVAEVLARRAKNAKHYRLADGSFKAVIESHDIHFEDVFGNLHNSNTDLIDEADIDSHKGPIAKEGAERFSSAREKVRKDKKENKLNRDLFDYQGLQVPFDCHIPRNFKRGYTVGKGQDKLTFRPVGSSPSKGYLDDVEQNKIVYQDVWNDADVELAVLPNGVKETIILKTDRSPIQFAFEVTGPLEDDLRAGQLTIQPAWLKDKNGQERDVQQTVRRDGEKTYIDLVADVEGLTYPIEIDPTVTVQTAGVGTIVAGSSYVGMLLNSDTFLLGRGSTSIDLQRASMKFPSLGTIPANAFIKSALFEMYMYSSGPHINLTLQRITADWEGTHTWANMPAVTTVGQAVVYSLGETGWKTFNITDMFRLWHTGAASYYGWRLSGEETTNSRYQQFYSQFTSNSAKPKLTIDYDMPPGKPTVTTPNGGETWNAQHTINWTAATDSDTAQASLKYHIQLSTDNGVNYSDVIALTAVGATSLAYDFTNEPQTSTAKIRVRAFDGSSYGDWDESNGVFSIIHNQAPTKPTNLSPAGGTAKDRASVTRLSWQHNDPDTDPQAQYSLRWRQQGTSTWNEILGVASVNQYRDITANSFPKANIEWQVMTYDQAGVPSPWSDVAVFFAGDKPANPTITSPLDLSTVAVANPTIQWSSVGQADYHLRVRDILNAVIWESIKTSTNKAETVTFDLENSEGYTVELAVKNADGLWSDFVSIGISVSYTPPPKPLVATSTDGDRASITLNIINPSPIEPEPVVSYNDIFRRKQGELNWLRVATNVIGQFTDNTPQSEQTYEYKVRAWGDNDTFTDSDIVTASVKVKDAQLALTNDYSNWVPLVYDPKRSEKRKVERALMQFSGRTEPVAEFDENGELDLGINYTIFSKSELDKLIALCESRQTLLYRDSRGRREFVTVDGININDERSNYWSVSITPSRVFMDEEV